MTRIRYSSKSVSLKSCPRLYFRTIEGKLRRAAAHSILNEGTKKSVQPRTSSWERSFHSRVQTWSERKLVWKCDIPDSSRKLIESMTRGNIIVIQYYRFRRLSRTTRISVRDCRYRLFDLLVLIFFNVTYALIHKLRTRWMEAIPRGHKLKR